MIGHKILQEHPETIQEYIDVRNQMLDALEDIPPEAWDRVVRVLRLMTRQAEIMRDWTMGEELNRMERESAAGRYYDDALSRAR